MDTLEAKKLINEAGWTFAKTMPKNPHEYTLKKNWPNKDKFEQLVIYIRAVGKTEKFGGRDYQYLYLDGWKYWTMGAPISETILINRAKA